MTLCSFRTVCDCRPVGAQVLRPLNRVWFCFGPAPGADRAADRARVDVLRDIQVIRVDLRRFARKPLSRGPQANGASRWIARTSEQ